MRTEIGAHGAVAAGNLRSALLDLLDANARGFLNAAVGSWVASELGISERVLRALVHELRLEGQLIGTTNGSGSGYFLIVDEADLEEGTRHVRNRAIASLRRVSVLRRNARERFSRSTIERLFDVEEFAR